MSLWGFRSIINKIGRLVLKNGISVKATLEGVLDTLLLVNDRIRGLSGLRFLAGYMWFTISISDEVSKKDIFTIDDKKYRVLKTKQIWFGNDFIYTEAIIYQDFLNYHVAIHSQEIANDQVTVGEKKIELDCSLTSLNEKERAEFALLNGERPTHIFLAGVSDIKYDIIISDRIVSEKGDFTIVALENLNEKDEFLLMSAKRVYLEDVNKNAPKPDFQQKLY